MDGILKGLIEREELITTVRWVAIRLDHNEYRGGQMSLGLKLSASAFSRGRCMPTVVRFQIDEAGSVNF